jgi:hypothetical protein
VFENRVLRKIFGAEEEVTVEWRKLHNKKLRDICCSLNVIRVNKSRGMRWVVHVACIGKIEINTGKPKEKKPLELST